MSDHTSLIACHECDCLQSAPAVEEGSSLRCARCGARLLISPKGGLDLPLALALGALILFSVANAFPLLELDFQGRSQASSLAGAAFALMREGSMPLGLAVLAMSVLIPGLVIGITLYLLLAVRLRRRWPLLRPLLRLLSTARPWGMLDVFMLGILVSMVKLAGMATLVLGAGLYAFIPLIFFSAAMATTLETRVLWERLERMA